MSEVLKIENLSISFNDSKKNVISNLSLENSSVGDLRTSRGIWLWKEYHRFIYFKASTRHSTSY